MYSSGFSFLFFFVCNVWFIIVIIMRERERDCVYVVLCFVCMCKLNLVAMIEKMSGWE